MKLFVRLLFSGLLAGLAMLGVGYWNATRPPVVVARTLDLPGLAPGTRIRALHITDVHAGNPDMRRRRLESIVAAANAQRPDIILLTGDYIGGKWLDWPRYRLEDALQPLADLSAPLGVFASMGNHDSVRWTPIVMGRASEPRLLVDTHVRTGPLAVAALNSAAFGADLGAALAGIPPGTPTLLLAHEGDEFIGRTRPEGLDPLVLSGHTHGGQVRLPFGFYPADHVMGRPACRRGGCILNGWRLFVSSGMGTTFLPVRFGVPPEMVLLTLVPPVQDSGRKSGTER